MFKDVLFFLVLGFSAYVVATLTPAGRWLMPIAIAVSLAIGWTRWRECRRARRTGLALALILFWPAAHVCAADLTAPTPAIVDLSQIVNMVIELVLTFLGAIAVAVLRRGVALLYSIHLFNADQVHMQSIDDVVGQAVDWVRATLEAIVDPHAKIQVQSSILAKAAQMVVDQAPMAVASTGFTTAGAKAKIEVALGNYLNPPAPDPAAAQAQPA